MKYSKKTQNCPNFWNWVVFGVGRHQKKTGKKKTKKNYTLPRASDGPRQRAFADGQTTWPSANLVALAGCEATTWQAFADSQGRRQMLHLCRGPDGVALGKGDGIGYRLAWAHFVEGLSLLRARPSAKRTFAKCEPLPTARHSAKDSLPTAGPGPR